MLLIYVQYILWVELRFKIISNHLLISFFLHSEFYPCSRPSCLILGLNSSSGTACMEFVSSSSVIVDLLQMLQFLPRIQNHTGRLRRLSLCPFRALTALTQCDNARCIRAIKRKKVWDFKWGVGHLSPMPPSLICKRKKRGGLGL